MNLPLLELQKLEDGSERVQSHTTGKNHGHGWLWRKSGGPVASAPHRRAPPPRQLRPRSSPPAPRASWNSKVCSRPPGRSARPRLADTEPEPVPASREAVSRESWESRESREMGELRETGDGRVGVGWGGTFLLASEFCGWLQKVGNPGNLWGYGLFI